MRNHNCKSWLLLLVGLSLYSGCASSTAPRGWLSQAHEIETQAYGGWIGIETKPGVEAIPHGELIALHHDSVFVLASDSNLYTVAISDIKKARLAGYDSEWDQMAALVFLGTLSTASHGGFLVLTAPILWGLAGGATAGSQSRVSLIDYPKRRPKVQGKSVVRENDQHPLRSMREYARFPQGWPPSLDRSTLILKKTVK